MFKLAMRATWLGCCFGVLMCGASVQAAATVSLKAVKKNGVAITPTNNLTGVAANDVITAEVLLSGWGHPNFDAAGENTGLLRTYQAQLDGIAGVQSSGPGHGYILPEGWDAPIVRDPCPCNEPLYPTCNTSYGCVGPNFHADKMASLDIARPDFILAFFVQQSAVALDSLDLKWGGTIQDSDGQPDGRCVAGSNAGFPCASNAGCPGSTCAVVPFYAGTLNLKVMPGACGTFTFTFKNDIGVTFIGNPALVPTLALPAIEPLMITTTAACSDGACCNENTGVCTDGVIQSNCQGAGMRWGGLNSTCATLNPPCASTPKIVSSDPPHCTIDARIPFPANTPAQRRGFQSIVLTFDKPTGATEDAAADYTVQQFPASINTTISSVVLNGNTATLNFAAPIQFRRWTCFLHKASNTRACLGYLPADANGDRTSAPVDILEIIDNLNGVRNPPLGIHQCDTDRSNLCAPADILSEIDLLNGANGWPVFNGSTLEVCPSMVGP